MLINPSYDLAEVIKLLLELHFKAEKTFTIMSPGVDWFTIQF